MKRLKEVHKMKLKNLETDYKSGARTRAWGKSEAGDRTMAWGKSSEGGCSIS